jgi:predicted nuclease with TOPRIM domain
MKKEAVAKRKRNKLTRIDKIEKALQKLIEEGEKVSKRIKEISEENERGFRELREITARTSERVDKTSEEVAKTSEEIRKLKTEISRLTGSWGEFVEGMIEPSAIKFMEEKGFKVVGVYPEAKVSRNGMNAEYDLYLVCEKPNKKNNKKEKVILLVSAKTKVSSKDVDELLEDMKNFFFFLEEYKGYKLMGAIAGIRFGKGADIYALRSGLIVMKPAEEVMQIQEPKKIRFVE